MTKDAQASGSFSSLLNNVQGIGNGPSIPARNNDLHPSYSWFH